ncbi:MAG TPA: 3-oxoacyl-ACP reductase family protein [bacterium]|nr:3-oxoacyl-ACP reductase family protein [bacterium]
MGSTGKLDGKVAIITGAGRGIGRAIAVAFAEAGAKVALAARSAGEIEEVAAQIRSAGGQAIAVATDVAKRSSVDNLVKQTVEKLGGVHILVNNAGITAGVLIAKMEDGLWERIIQTNLTGSYYCIKAVLPHLMAQRHGRIINIASTLAKSGHAYSGAYSASKHGVLGLVRSLALEVTRYNITVNAICPGWTEAGMLSGSVENIVGKTGMTPEQAKEALIAESPQKRAIEPEEVASLAVYLSTEDARGINGQGINVCGGTVMS